MPWRGSEFVFILSWGETDRKNETDKKKEENGGNQR